MRTGCPLLLGACAQAAAPTTTSEATAAPAVTISPETAATPEPATPSDATAAPAADEPIYLGVSGPLTGQNAHYGEQWKKGFDLTLEEIDGAGGIDGRPLEYIFEDLQSDPKQSVVVAHKFVANERIIVELGDFNSGASMAASQIYERGGLVPFSFTNPHPDFTNVGGTYTWSNSNTQALVAPALADYAITRLGLSKLPVFYFNTDWGKTTYELFAARVKELGAEIVSEQAYLAEEKDFRSALMSARDAKPNGIILVSYQADGALLVQKIRELGLELPIVGGDSLQSPDFLNLGGEAVEGVYVLGGFHADDPDPVVRAFVEKY